MVGNTENVTSNGEVFTATSFAIAFPTDDPEQPPRARIQIDNVNREIVQAVRSIDTSPAIQLDIVRHAAPDTLEITLPDFQLTNITYDALVVTGDLTFENFLQEPYPSPRFDPGRFPGGF